MVYVPIPTGPPESPRVRELSQRIQQVISDFQRQYPMSAGEIRQALLHAARVAGGDGRQRLALALVGGVVAALGIGGFVAQRAGGGAAGAAGMPVFVAIGVAAAVAGLAIAIRRNR